MSKIYKVHLASSLTRSIQAADRMQHRVELTPILDEASMRDLLRQALRDAGWEEQEDGTFRTAGPNGESLVWDVAGDTVTATAEAEREVSAELGATGWGESDVSARQDAQRTIERQRARVEAEIADTEAALGRELSRDLERGEDARRRQLNGVVQRVYSDALKRKAEQLGTVVSVEEQTQGDDYELVIRITE